jgi:hypothetical protein
MKGASGRVVPCLPLAILLAAAACRMVPDVDRPSEPVAAETKVGANGSSAARDAAVADMRARAKATEALPYPSAFAASRNSRLAARSEPRPVADVESIKAELAAIGKRRQNPVSATELAALDARAATLRRLLAATQSGALRP